ncbi:MAG: hypothetical protein V4450_07205 [Bacteroidota bacterium]
MKKYFLIAVIGLMLPFASMANTLKDTTDADKKSLPFYIETCVDKMTDKSYAFGSKSMLCSDDGKKGFIVRVGFNLKKDQVNYSGLTVKSAQIGSCVDKSTLIFLFEDDTKTTATAWNDFNCDGNSYFDFNGKMINELSQKKLKSIRFTNGRTFDSFTYDVPEKDRSFFIEAKNALDQKRFVPGKCN